MTLKIVYLRQKHMATDFTFMVSVKAREVARAECTLEQALGITGRLEDELTEFRSKSPVARFNASQVGEKIPIPDNLLELLEISQRITSKSDGAFTIFAKSRLQKGQDDAHLVAGQQWAAWDQKTKLIWKLRGGAHLGFGAVGKGYALDKVSSFLIREGFHDFVLNAGGSSLVLSGFQAPNIPWPWAWSWQKDADGQPLGIEFQHSTGRLIALGISGLHEQGEHILDPLRGGKANQLLSALVARPSAAEADALSTALFVSGTDGGAAFLQAFGDDLAWAYADKMSVPAWNGVFQNLWGEPDCAPVLSDFDANLTKQKQSFIPAFSNVVLFVSALTASPVLAHAEGEAVDLSALGISTFTPYIVERNSWWILLPVVILAMVFAHLPFPWNRKSRKGN